MGTDSKRLALVVADPDPDANPPGNESGVAAKPKVPKPIVIDRYKFKQDIQGYLLSGRHSYVYLFDLATKKLERLTTGKWDESGPSWSLDGSRIAFMSNHATDPDREPSNQVFVAEAKAGAVEKQLTPQARGRNSRLAWSPDSQRIAFVEGEDKKYGTYFMGRLFLVTADGSSAPML